MSTFIYFFQNKVKFIPLKKKQEKENIIIFLWFSPGTPNRNTRRKSQENYKTDRNNTRNVVESAVKHHTPLEFSLLL